MSKSKKTTLQLREIRSLNLDDLDVVDLEQRIELASAVPTEMAWGCDCDGDCPTFESCGHCDANCPCNGTYSCDTYCPSECGTNCPVFCDVNCDVDLPSGS